MGITPSEATEVAKRYGLSLQDAAGLAALADSVEEAEQLAADFGDHEAQFRATVRRLFEDEQVTPIERALTKRAQQQWKERNR